MAGSNMTSESTSFSDNTATTAAGAVGIAGTAELVSFTDCDFTSNTAGKHGGALQNYGGEKPGSRSPEVPSRTTRQLTVLSEAAPP